MRDEHLGGNPARHVQRALGFSHGVRARVRVGARQRQRRAPPAAEEAVGDRRVNAVQLETRVREPLLQVRHRRRVVVIEVRARREQLERFESVRGDLQQMFAAQPLTVVEMRRHAELSFGHSEELL